MAADRRRLWRVYLLSVPVWALLAIPVDRNPDDLHLELRELTALQAGALAVGVVGAAAAEWLAAEHGPFRWIDVVRSVQRCVSVALLGLATVAGLYAVALLFR